jgi:hypothetical protein
MLKLTPQHQHISVGVYIHYTYIVGKYKIYLYLLLEHVEKRVQINFIFNDNVHILCLSCNIKKSKRPAKFSENNWNKRFSNCFQLCSYCYRFCRWHESGTRNALLCPWPNNTEVYLTPVISTKNYTIAHFSYI